MANRHWCFTVYDMNWFPHDWHENHRYTVVQLEKCPETGKKHWQGYTELNEPMRMEGFIEQIIGVNDCHVEKRKGSRLEARVYCMEEETRIHGPYEFGKWNKKGQGNRTDHDNVANEIKENGFNTAVETYPGHFIRFHRGMERLSSRINANKVRKITVREGQYEDGMYCVQRMNKFEEYMGEKTIYVPWHERNDPVYEDRLPVVVNKHYAAWTEVVYEPFNAGKHLKGRDDPWDTK